MLWRIAATASGTTRHLPFDGQPEFGERVIPVPRDHVEQPPRYYLVIDRKTANTPGLELTNELRARADKVMGQTL